MLLELDMSTFAERLKIKIEDEKRYVFGHIRRKWLVLTPEEFIRQIILHYLIEKEGYNRNRIAVERQLSVNGLTRRCDILVFNQDMEPQLLIECKSYKVALTQAVFNQVANYNIPLQVPFLMVTNGAHSFCCAIDQAEKSYQYLNHLPAID